MVIHESDNAIATFINKKKRQLNFTHSSIRTLAWPGRNLGQHEMHVRRCGAHKTQAPSEENSSTL
jgi:hypothetical protein